MTTQEFLTSPALGDESKKQSRMLSFCVDSMSSAQDQVGKSVSGVYLILNQITMQAYIGQSTDVARRWVEHKTMLAAGNHHNKKLQVAWSQYGSERFSFLLFASVEPDDLLALEGGLVSESIGDCYNFTDAQRGQGRKSLQGAGASPVIRIRVTPEQKAKVESLGGAVWVRKMIDKARLPAINSEG